MIFCNQGNSLRLRKTEPEDAPTLLCAYQDESFIRLYHSNNIPLSQEQLADRLAEQNPVELGYVEFMIEHKKYGAIGVAVLSDYSPVHKRAEYLIGLFKEKYRSRGYGTEASLLVLDLAFNIYNLNKIYTYVYDYNKLSQKNTLKFGFKQEGILEEHHYLLQEKRFVNLYINGMTEARFRNNEQIRRYSLRLLGRDVTQANYIIKLSEDDKLPNEMGKKFVEGWLSQL